MHKATKQWFRSGSHTINSAPIVEAQAFRGLGTLLGMAPTSVGVSLSRLVPHNSLLEQHT